MFVFSYHFEDSLGRWGARCEVLGLAIRADSWYELINKIKQYDPDFFCMSCASQTKLRHMINHIAD